MFLSIPSDSAHLELSFDKFFAPFHSTLQLVFVILTHAQLYFPWKFILEKLFNQISPVRGGGKRF